MSQRLRVGNKHIPYIPDFVSSSHFIQSVLYALLELFIVLCIMSF